MGAEAQVHGSLLRRANNANMLDQNEEGGGEMHRTGRPGTRPSDVQQPIPDGSCSTRRRKQCATDEVYETDATQHDATKVFPTDTNHSTHARTTRSATTTWRRFHENDDDENDDEAYDEG